MIAKNVLNNFELFYTKEKTICAILSIAQYNLHMTVPVEDNLKMCKDFPSTKHHEEFSKGRVEAYTKSFYG